MNTWWINCGFLNKYGKPLFELRRVGFFAYIFHDETIQLLLNYKPVSSLMPRIWK